MQTSEKGPGKVHLKKKNFFMHTLGMKTLIKYRG